jgi:tight adherence protein C
MKSIFFLTSFVFLTLVCSGILHYYFRRELVMERRLAPLINKKQSSGNSVDSNESEEAAPITGIRTRFLIPVIDRLKNRIQAGLSKEESKRLEAKLRDSGNPFNMSPVDLRLTQLSLGLFMLVFFFFLFELRGIGTGKSIAFSLGSGLYGFVAPSLYLNAKKKRRILAIQKAMSDFFDMVNISVEAGLGFDAAIAKVCVKFKSPLSIEFLLTLEEMKLGKTRREAFSNLRDRVPLEQFQNIISALLQSDQLGIGISKVLRTLTQRVREQRREAAREKAMKAPIKMLFPMLFFIFPTLFIVVLGPVMIFFLSGSFKI